MIFHPAILFIRGRLGAVLKQVDELRAQRVLMQVRENDSVFPSFGNPHFPYYVFMLN